MTAAVKPPRHQVAKRRAAAEEVCWALTLMMNLEDPAVMSRRVLMEWIERVTWGFRIEVSAGNEVELVEALRAAANLFIERADEIELRQGQRVEKEPARQ